MKFDWLDYWLNSNKEDNKDQESQNETIEAGEEKQLLGAESIEVEDFGIEHVPLKDNELSRIVFTLDDESNVRILTQYNTGKLSAENADSMALLLCAINTGSLEAEVLTSATRGGEIHGHSVLQHVNHIIETYRDLTPRLNDKPVINPSEVFKTILTQGKV